MIENSVPSGWKVSVVDNYENVGEYIYKVLKENQSRLAVRSRNNIFNRLVVDFWLKNYKKNWDALLP